jgi:CubicO group peptidase (beta-lactamase class C family)
MRSMKTFTPNQLTAVVFAVAIGASACSSNDSRTDAGELGLPSSTSSTEVVVETITTTVTEEVPAETLGDTLDTIVADTGVPALGAAVFDSNGPIDMAVSGMRQRDGTDQVGVDDRFHLGSNTKAMTAALLARLHERGRGITFETTLAEAFPAVTEIHPDFAPVTMVQLMAHSGGVPIESDPELEELDEEAEFEAFVALPPVEARAVGSEWVITKPPVVPPDTAGRYSNTNYVIVGAAMEAATGESWENLMTAEVFTPLGMTSCGFGPPGVEGGVDQPSGHDPTTGRPVYDDNPAVLGPAGTVHCSMADWGLFLTEFLKGFRGESDFLTEDSVNRLFEPAPVPVEGDPASQFALGWVVEEDPEVGHVYWHNGSNTMWYSHAIVVPGSDRVVLAVSNEAQTGQEATILALDALVEKYGE